MTVPSGRRGEPRMTRAFADLPELSPANFAMVMATGIISIGLHQRGLAVPALVLFGLNLAAWVMLWVLTVLRTLRSPRRLGADLVDHLRGPGFFTMVAATAVLGSQFVLLIASFRVAIAFLALSGLLWVGLTYTIFAAFTIKEEKPTLDQGISGSWLLAVVATQSLAVLSALIAAHFAQPLRLELNFFALSMWLWGGMLYIWMMSLIFYRYTFFHFSPGDLTPPYWINMGAMAISTLAGATLIANASDAPFLHGFLPFLKGFTVFYWATGTWWIPMLLVLGVWRHGYKRFPLRYDPQYWGAVFPLGMYAVGTRAMAGVMKLGFVGWLPTLFQGIALVAWTAAFIGLLRRLIHYVR
ncbi:MAG TPA: tellurite resistance/C4-dicarboxylate transporter family protein [Candidatus Binataceae bacterium]|nr:tellurite resistance/C4-dicarboxylate transporter family protein [Candidatus Binataceae bacterium]